MHKYLGRPKIVSSVFYFTIMTTTPDWIPRPSYGTQTRHGFTVVFSLRLIIFHAHSLWLNDTQTSFQAGNHFLSSFSVYVFGCFLLSPLHCFNRLYASFQFPVWLKVKSWTAYFFPTHILLFPSPPLFLPPSFTCNYSCPHLGCWWSPQDKLEEFDFMCLLLALPGCFSIWCWYIFSPACSQCKQCRVIVQELRLFCSSSWTVCEVFV